MTQSVQLLILAFGASWLIIHAPHVLDGINGAIHWCHLMAREYLEVRR
jgi:hypothetical protein